MRILYGSHTQGQGGLAKAAVLIPLLKSLGHEVCLVTSGRAPLRGFALESAHHFPGLEYVVHRGQTDYLQTFLRWVREVPSLLGTLRRLRRICREFRPDLVLSDFELLTAHPLLRPGCEVLAVSRPVALIDGGVPLPEGNNFDRRIARTTIRLFTAGADRRFGYHLEPATYRCLPPVIGADIASLAPTAGEHLLVYNVYHAEEGRAADLVQWSKRTQVPVVAYGFPEVGRRERVGFVEFRPPSRERFLQDLASCRAAITTAGLSLPVEAHQLGKPVSVVPIPRQWEQYVNASHLEQAGIARWLTRWDYSAALDVPPPAGPLHHWLSRGPHDVLKRILPAEALAPAVRRAA
jgi:uncharacterized protein (TIGR00661 family)